MSQDNVHREAFKEIVGNIKNTTVNSVGDFLRVAGVVLTYDGFDIYHPEPLGERYVRNHQRYARDNLTIKSILEDIVNGSDISSLMEVPEDTFYRVSLLRKSEDEPEKHYKWGTGVPEHRRVLDKIRALGNAMYSNVSTAFTETDGYNEMVDVAKGCLEASKDKFDFWESIVNVDPNSIARVPPKEFAQTIFDYVREQPSVVVVRQGLRALMYLESKYPDHGIGGMIKDYTSYFLQNEPPGKHRHRGKLMNLLQEVGSAH